jgi:hypothetical protein
MGVNLYPLYPLEVHTHWLGEVHLCDAMGGRGKCGAGERAVS